MRSFFVPLAILVAGSVAAALPAQGGASLGFSGSAVLGRSVDLLVGGGPPSGTVVVLLSPEVGSTRIGSFETDCFALGRFGLGLLDVPLSGQGSARLPIAIPAAPSLAGVYLAALGLAVVPGLPRTNCASFMVVPDSARPNLLLTFDTAAVAAPSLGAADWAGSVRGAVRPGRVGGAGRLGRFDPTAGTLRDGAYVFRTDDQVFAAGRTLSGAAVRVTDGVFEFLDFEVPAGVTVRFEGMHPARILVAGAARIDGVLDVSAPAVDVADGGSGLEAGQAGGVAGAGAGAGGAGGDLPTLAGGSVDGRPGEDLRAPSAGAYGQATAATGGRGSPAQPPGADPLQVRYRFFGFYSNQIAGGAGGAGGPSAAGSPGRLVAERPPLGDGGPSGAAGRALGAPGTPGTSRSDLLIGGAGGGGGGTHPYDSLWPQVRWTRGAGGGGGGGAVLLAVGGDLTIGIDGALRADGGAAAVRTDADGAFLAPGGGGGGGTVLLQVGGTLHHDGQVTARGAVGGQTADLRATLGASVAGGDGAAGRIRIETGSTGRGGGNGTFDPPAEFAGLTDVDPWTVAASTWLSLPPGADPAAFAYELHAVEGAIGVLYSDVAGVGAGPALRGAAPFVLVSRFGQVDAQRQPLPGTAGPWTEGAAAPIAGANAVQFLLMFDRALLGGASDLRVEALRLLF